MFHFQAFANGQGVASSNPTSTIYRDDVNQVITAATLF